ncbi:uncharacterized protein LOC131174435 [Hevea brasiliensis]|uniref:uncharacterized protein LOC131174435 n=1 Tax=Hevea brasiliensis TaxID=3981 RepID=UPI0025D1A66D|nr:uncharacterized protein LOC131174435 [Hevea brasiliensis]
MTMKDDEWEELQQKSRDFASCFVEKIGEPITNSLYLNELYQLRMEKVTTLTVKNETLKVAEVTTVSLDDEKFKKTSSSNASRAFIASSNHDDDEKKIKDPLQDEWLIDSTCLFHICSKNEWFNVIEEKKGENVKLAKEKKMEVERVGRMKIKLHGDRVKLFNEVRYIPKFERNLISLGKIDSLGYGNSIQGEVIRVSQSALVIMKGEKISAKNLYKLEGRTLIGSVMPQPQDHYWH